jgi:hypothetical protein
MENINILGLALRILPAQKPRGPGDIASRVAVDRQQPEDNFLEVA